MGVRVGRLMRLLTITAMALLLTLSLGARPVAAASGGGCRNSENSIAHVGVCISYRPSDRVLLPDFYVNRSFFSGSSFTWHVELHRGDGARWSIANFPNRGVGHYGPTVISTGLTGAGATVRSMVRLQSVDCCGNLVIWAGPFYSPWLSYP